MEVRKGKRKSREGRNPFQEFRLVKSMEMGPKVGARSPGDRNSLGKDEREGQEMRTNKRRVPWSSAKKIASCVTGKEGQYFWPEGMFTQDPVGREANQGAILLRNMRPIGASGQKCHTGQAAVQRREHHAP